MSFRQKVVKIRILKKSKTKTTIESLNPAGIGLNTFEPTFFNSLIISRKKPTEKYYRNICYKFDCKSSIVSDDSRRV